jgi:hypothetical protein
MGPGRSGPGASERYRAKAALQEEFPTYDFSGLPRDGEGRFPWIEKLHEDREARWARGREALDWLLARPEENIAVASHSLFMLTAIFNPLARHLEKLTVLAADGSRRVVGDRLDVMSNCEIRTCQLSRGSKPGTFCVHIVESHKIVGSELNSESKSFNGPRPVMAGPPAQPSKL